MRGFSTMALGLKTADHIGQHSESSKMRPLICVGRMGVG